MLFFSRKKHSPSNSAPPIGLASQSQATQQLQFPTKSQSQSHSPQPKQQSQPVNPWSAHAPPLGQSPSPLPRYGHALSTTATAAGELFLFGGCGYDSSYNDLYVFSTRDFSSTLLQTSGGTPSPRQAHGAVLTSALLFVWGGWTDRKNVQNHGYDDSVYLLNLGISDLLMSRPTPADYSFLPSSIARVDSHRGQWSRARRSFWQHRDFGWFQSLRLWWPDRSEVV